MKITVIGATGMVGARVTDEAVRRGHHVTGIARNRPRRPTPACVRWVAADANDTVALRSLLADTDAAVLSVRPAPGFEATLAVTTGTVLDAAAAAANRVLVVGGAGPLRSPNHIDLLVADNTEYVPAEYSAIAAASTQQLRACQRHPVAEWTYVSPASVSGSGAAYGHLPSWHRHPARL